MWNNESNTLEETTRSTQINKLHALEMPYLKNLKDVSANSWEKE